MEFTAEELKEIEDFGSINENIHNMARYFNIAAEEMHAEFRKLDSPFRIHFDRGLIRAQTSVNLNTLEEAKSGNLNATVLYKKAIHTQYINRLKYEYFGL
jgi:hypothetical protein